MNVTYKMASTVISNRLKGVLDKLIHQDQKGFISGRFIGENIRLIYDVLFETQNQNIPGLLLSIDFEKAFDTVSWKFINKTLDYFNLGVSIRKWINIFQTGAESCILQNGFMSELFYLKRGCRQGDPISPYIFILCAEVLGQMIRNNESIRGIIINNKEYKISQYADDTQLLLDGSEESLRQTLRILERYYKMSGLKINVDKTKAIWIGTKQFSDENLCSDYNLDWSKGPFKVLGVTFSSNVGNIWDLNTNETLNNIKNLLERWAKRKLTLIGRITIIKSLALSKFVHLFLSLPDPPKELVKELEKCFYGFLWNGGHDRISRRVIIKNMSCGGLRMVQLPAFIKALKISWIRRIIKQHENNEWFDLSTVNFSKLLSMGTQYAERLTETLINPFWKDLMKHWSDFGKVVRIENIKQILDSPLWLNGNIGSGKLYIKDWYEKGIKSVYDLIDANGNWYEFNRLKEIYKIRGTVLDHVHVLSKIPNDWKFIINNNKVYSSLNKQMVTCNVYVTHVIKYKKGSRNIYDLFVGADEINSHVKWQATLGDTTENEWKTYHSYITNIKEIKLRDFQYKINNKILVTNSFLRKINRIDSGLCTYCNEKEEKIFHLFLECRIVNQFWNQLKNWLETNTNINFSLERRRLLFSVHGQNELVNYIYVVSKYYIYKNKFSGNRLNIQAFESMLKHKMNGEKYIAFVHNKPDQFFRKWGPIYNHFIANE